MNNKITDQSGQTVHGPQINPQGDANIGQVGDNTYILPTPLPTPTFPLHRLRFQRNPHFTGREEWLTMIDNNLRIGQTTIVTQAITGLGGVGKTQLVLEYCYLHREEYDLIDWLAADDLTSLSQSLADLAYTLGVARREAGEQETAVKAALHWLENSEQSWLLVYDNADHIEPQAMPAYMPKLGNGVRLITSRNPAWQSLTDAENLLRLEVFPGTEAVAFLEQHSGQMSDAAAEALAKALGYLPLALEHAAAYMITNHKSYGGYLALFRQKRQELWARVEIRHDYEKTITTTWEIAFSEAKKTLGARELLNLCCFLAAEPIPIALLTDYPAALPENLAAIVQDELTLDDALTALQRYSLVSRSDNQVTIHRLVQAVGRDRMGEERRGLWGEAAVNLTLHTIPNDKYMIYTWDGVNLLSHTRAAVDLSLKYELETQTTAILCTWIGLYLEAMGKYEAAHPYYESSLDVNERILGPTNPATATSLNNKGALLTKMGRYKETYPFFKRSLEIKESVLGPDHPDTATSLSNMGYLLQAMGEYDAARPFYERALETYKRVSGPDHPDVSTVLNNIGFLLERQGKYQAAHSYHQRSLEICESALGPDHPSTATSLNNMGIVLQAMGEYDMARPFYQRSLEIRKRVLGPNHPRTTTSLNNIGFLLNTLGDYEEAHPFFLQALDSRERVLGPDHPLTAGSLNNVAISYYQIGNFREAVRLMRRALAIREKALGPEHPYTLNSRESLTAIEAKSNS